MEIFRLNNILVEKNNINLFTLKELKIDRGDKVVIIGVSGSGKSTLLKLFNGLEKPKKGEVLYKSENIFNKNLFLLRREVILIDQEPFLNGPTVKEFFYYIKNFSVYKNFNINEEEIFSLLKLFSLEYIKLDRKIDTLSGGEKQKLAIIRGILLKPEVLLLDEPTSALDKENIELLINNLLKSNLIETIISVSHNQLWIKNCNLELEINKKIVDIKREIKNGKDN